MKSLINEVTRLRKVMGLSESKMPEFMKSDQLFSEAPQPAPARPEVNPDVDAPPKEKPGQPKRKNPFAPKPGVNPKPKAELNEDLPYGGFTDKIIVKTSKMEFPLYLKKIDSTHLETSYDMNVERGAVWHVAQLKGEPYYADLVKWLHDNLEINGRSYNA
jgi:hypothetical protein